jgi:hypothetical protein
VAPRKRPQLATRSQEIRLSRNAGRKILKC